MTFTIIRCVRGTVDDEAELYLAYMLGSITFPATTFRMDPARRRNVLCSYQM